MKKIAYLLGYAIAFAVIFYASSALAASPQDILNQNLKNYGSSGANLSGEVHMNLQENVWVDDYVNGPEKANFSLSFAQRSLPADKNGNKDGEGYFKIDKLYIEDGEDVFTLSDPLMLFWRTVSAKMYIKVGMLPESIKNQLTELGADLSPLTQRWFTFDAPRQESWGEFLPQVDPTDSETADNLSEMFATLSDKNFLQVTGVEKRYKNQAGEDMVRVRIDIDKDVVQKKYQDELNEVAKITDPDARSRSMDIIHKEYEQNLEDAEALHMAANINLASQRVERIEFGLKQTQDKEDCEWNDDFTDKTCRVIGQTTVTFRAGIWLSEPTNEKVNIPYNAMTMEQAESFFERVFSF